MSSPLDAMRRQHRGLLRAAAGNDVPAARTIDAVDMPRINEAMRLLDRPEWHNRHAGASRLRRAGRGVVPLLANLLEHEPSGQRQECLLEALGRIGDSRATQAVQRVLRDSSPRVRHAAVKALRGLALEPEMFLPALVDKAWRVRREAVLGLSAFPGGAAAFLLERCLADAHHQVRASAANVLGMFRAAPARPLLRAALQDPSRRVCEMASWALRRLTSPFYQLETVLSGLRYASGEQRLLFVAALGDFGDAGAARILLGYTSDPQVQVRREAVLALGRTRQPEAVAALVAIARAPGSGLGSCAALALAACGTLSAPALCELARDRQEGARVLASRALGFLEARHAAEPLYAALVDESPRVREETAVALARVKLQAASRFRHRAAPAACPACPASRPL